jgi:hypothetical protein
VPWTWQRVRASCKKRIRLPDESVSAEIALMTTGSPLDTADPRSVWVPGPARRLRCGW